MQLTLCADMCSHASLSLPKFSVNNTYFSWAVVVALLVERLLPTPEARGSNPVIWAKLILIIYSQLYYSKEEIGRKRG